MRGLVAALASLALAVLWMAAPTASSSTAFSSTTETFVVPLAAEQEPTAISEVSPSTSLRVARFSAAPTTVSQRQVPDRPVEVVLWGDSLAAEATASFDMFFAGRDDVVATEVVWPGIAVCDALPSIAARSAERSVDVAVIEFSGNAYTDCMIDPATGEGLAGDGLIDRYEADVTAAVEMLGDAGATVVLAGAPPVVPDGEWADRVRVVDLYRQVAARYDYVRFVDTGAGLSLDGEFTESLPCLGFEGESQGCVDGWIQVRNDDGLHVGLGDPDVWSSGSYRYGMALAMAAQAAIFG